MRFYLLYKNHGLYDPVLDDTEYIYVPIDPYYLETNKGDNGTTQNAETKTSESTVKNGTSPLYIPENEKTKFKANFHEALLKLSAGDLPETARFKLPISEEYDPDGKKITKLQKLYTNKMMAVDLKTIMDKITEEECKTVEGLEKTYKDILETELKSQQQDELTKKELKYSHEIKDLNLESLKNTASRIVNDSIDKAVSVATQMTHKVDLETLQQIKGCNHKLDIHNEYLDVKSSKQSKAEKSKADLKLIKDNCGKDELTTEEQKERPNVAEEVKKFESFETSMDSKVNLEERKLWTKQDIEETIEEGTVRRRSEMFAKEMKSSEKMTKKSDVLYENFYNTDSHHERKQSLSNFETTKVHKTVRDLSSDIKKAKEKAFLLGLQTVPRLQALCSSSKSNLLMRIFFLQLTKIMVALSKYLMLEQTIATIPLERTITIQQKVDDEQQKNEHSKNKDETENKLQEDTMNKGEEIPENSSYEYTKDYYSSNSKKMNFEGEIIKKEKLSGAKIAQIEGNKPAELTDKMNVVISELQRKSVIEEQSDNEEFFRKSSQSSNKRTLDEDVKKSSVTNDTEDHFFDQHSKHFDRRKLFETIEEKTTLMDIKEMISKKHTTEYKSTKTSKQNGNIVYVAFVEAKHFPKMVTEITSTKNLFEHDVKTDMKNNENIIYVAVVEAHVYTNKDAIFEEQMISESKTLVEDSRKKSVDLESTKEVKIIESDSKKISLADTSIIEPVTVSLMVQPLPNKLVKYARSATDIEQISKKIAVQNIVDAIEPLLRLETCKFSDKQAQAVIETPMKAIAETTDVSTEEQQIFFNAEVSLTQKSFVSIEKPEPVVEITEITTEESENVPVESLKPIIAEPESIIEIAGKIVAEISEVKTDEAKIELFQVPEIINKKPSIVLEKPILSVAETIMATAEYSCEEIIVPKIVTDQAKINIGTKFAAEISEVSVIEKEHDTLNAQKVTQKQNETLHESSALMVAETTATFAAEPKDEALEITKAVACQANIDIRELKATETTLVFTEEPHHKNIEVLKINQKFTQATLENTAFPVAEALTISSEEPNSENLIIPQAITTTSEPLIEIPIFMVPESITIMPEGPKEENFRVLEPEIKIPNINIRELNPVVSNVVFPEEPKEESLNLPYASEKLPQISMQNCPLTVALSLAILLAGPKDSSLNIQSIITSQAKSFIETPNLTVAEVLTQFVNGPKDGDLQFSEIKKEQSRITIEEFISLIQTVVVPLDQYTSLELSKVGHESPKISIENNFLTVATALAILLTGPKDGNFDIAQFNTSEAEAVMEMPKYTLPECLVQLPYGPKDDSFEIPEIIKGQNNITIQEFISLVRSIVIPLDQYTDLELLKTDTKLPLISLESIFLSAAATTAVFLLGPDIDNFEIAKLTLEKANINFEQLRAHITNCVHFCEPKAENLEIPPVIGKLPHTTIENCLFVPESLVVKTEDPKEGSIEISEIKKEKADTILNKFKAIQVVIVLLAEYLNENLKLPQIIKRQPQVSIQETILHIANVLAVYTEEPIDEHFEVTKTTKQEARVKIEEMKAAEVKFMPLEEPEPEELVISKINKKQPQTSIESSLLTVAQKLAISSVESVEQSVDIRKAISQKASSNIETLKAAETSIIISEEPKQEIFNVSQIVDKKVKHSLVDTNLVTAESLIVQAEESTRTDLDVKMQKNQQAKIQIEELKALETTIINDEESKNEDFRIPAIELQQTEGIIEKSLKSVAQASMITTNEVGTEISVAEKVNEKHVSVSYESMIPVAQTIVTAIEEAHDVSQTFKSISNSAKSTLVESSVTAKAEVLEKDVNVLLEKPHIKKPKIEEIEIEANLKIPVIPDDSVSEVSAEYSVEFPKEENVYAEFEFGENKMDVVSEIYESIRLMKKQAFQRQSMEASLSLARELQTKIEMVEIEALEEEFIRSGSISSSSSMASSPLTPILEEYFFNIKGPYLRSQYRNIKDVFEEASLKLKSKIQKSTIQSFDASLTLILQDLAMAQLESEMNDIEVIEIEDYEDVRNLHFSTALLARSQKQSVVSFMSSEAKSFEAMQSSSLSESAYGYSMSVMDAALEQSIEASLGGTRHVSLESTLAGEQTSAQTAIMNASRSMLSSDSSEYASIQSASTKVKSSNISEIDLESEIDASMQSNAKVKTSGKMTSQASTSKSKSKAMNSMQSSVSGSEIMETSMEMEGSTESSLMQSKAMGVTAIEAGTMETSMSIYSKEKKSGKGLRKADLKLIQSVESNISDLSMESDKKLLIKTDVVGTEVNGNGKTPSPPILPPTPLTDEYIFRLQTEMPGPSEFIPRDCSISPERLEEDIILKCGLIPHIKTKI
ncbi:unnamed protein product, partial [Brenthis ino]